MTSSKVLVISALMATLAIAKVLTASDESESDNIAIFHGLRIGHSLQEIESYYKKRYPWWGKPVIKSEGKFVFVQYRPFSGPRESFVLIYKRNDESFEFMSLLAVPEVHPIEIETSDDGNVLLFSYKRKIIIAQKEWFGENAK